jgi:putative phage-type endonuclease
MNLTIDPRTVEQGSDLWKQLRLGHVTASNIADVMSKAKTGEATGRYKYKIKLVAERMINAPIESYSNAAMEWGIEQEQYAAKAYEAYTGIETQKTGFWLHPNIQWLGVSPDRLIGSDGLIEIKCPNTTTHLDNIFSKKVPSEYVKQIQCQLWVTDRKWCDFVSFDPRLPTRNQLFVVRLERDESLMKEMEVEVKKFLSEVDQLIQRLLT